MSRFDFFLRALQPGPPSPQAQSYGLSLLFATVLIALGVIVNIVSLRQLTVDPRTTDGRQRDPLVRPPLRPPSR